MIELRNRTLLSNGSSTEPKLHDFDVFVENEKIYADVWQYDDAEVEIELYEKFTSKQLLEKFGECNLEYLICYNQKPIKYILHSWGTHYDWEKLSFSKQVLTISSNSFSVAIQFFLHNEEYSSIWTYKYSPNHVFHQLSLINYDKINIAIKEDKGEWISLTVELKKEFTTTLLASYNELIKIIYEIEQELYKRLETFK